MTIWHTPAGIVDEGGMILQAWLNFGITLVAPPANGLMHVCAASPIDMPLLGQCLRRPKARLPLPVLWYCTQFADYSSMLVYTSAN